MMNQLYHDARFGFRSLCRTPGVTSASLVCLIIGIAVNTSIFSVLNGILWRPLSLPESERVVTVWDKSSDGARKNIGYETFADVRDRSRSLESLAAVRMWTPRLTGPGEPRRLTGVAVTHEFFEVAGVAPQLGRTFTSDEDRPGNDSYVILSDGLWRRSFQADPNIVGQSVTLSGIECVVLGVMPADFSPVISDTLYMAAELWAPLGYVEGDEFACRSCRHLRMVGRLAPGVSLDQARAELNAIAIDLKATHDDAYALGEFHVIGLHELIVGDVRPALYVLFAAVGFIMLIACANVANLLLTRSTMRRREFAVRAALGATRWRVSRQLFVEGILLGLIAAACGLTISVWGTDLLGVIGSDTIPRLDDVTIDGTVLAFTLGMAILTGVVFSLAPALEAMRSDLTSALKEESHCSASGTKLAMRRMLVTTEISLAIVLLIGGGLFIRSFLRVSQVDPGFESDNLLSFRLVAPSGDYPDAQLRLNFYDDVHAGLASLPGVNSVAAVSTLPFGGSRDQIGMIDITRHQSMHADAPSPDRYGIDQHYFSTMGIPLIAGRAFENADMADSTPVVIVNRTLARRMWPDEDPLGNQVRLGGGPQARTWTVVGVVGDVLQTDFESAPTMQVYLPHAQWPTGFMTLIIRAEGDDPMALADSIRRRIWAVNNHVPVQDIALMENLMARTVGERRFTMSLVSGFALTAALLAALGMYAVISFSVTQRTREIGIRVALGAARRDVVRLLLREGLSVTGLGLSLGLGAAWILSRFIEQILYDVSPGDPLTYLMVAGLVIAMSLIAVLLPTLQALRVDPMMALRYE